MKVSSFSRTLAPHDLLSFSSLTWQEIVTKASYYLYAFDDVSTAIRPLLKAINTSY